MIATLLIVVFELIQFLILIIFIYYVNKSLKSESLIERNIMFFIDENRRFAIKLNNNLEKLKTDFKEFKTNCNKSFDLITEKLHETK